MEFAPTGTVSILRIMQLLGCTREGKWGYHIFDIYLNMLFTIGKPQWQEYRLGLQITNKLQGSFGTLS